MARCLVLGANGFIGSYLVDELASKGHFVRCFDRFNTDTAFSASGENIEIYKGDFLSEESIESALDEIDYVFHFISTTTPMSAENDPIKDIESNVKMSVILFKLCVAKKIKKIIFASTGGSIYGETRSDLPLAETSLPRPVSPYAIGKLSIEHYLQYFQHKHNLDYTVFRLSNPYGPRQNTSGGQGIIPIFLEKIARNEPVTVYGDGTMARDYIFIEDLITILIDASFKNNSSEHVFNLGSGESKTINEIIEIMRYVTGEDFRIEHVESPSTFVSKVVLDTTLFKTQFGAFACATLNEGIEHTWQSMKK